MRFGPEFQNVLDAYHVRARTERQRMASIPEEKRMALRDELLLEVGPEVGWLLVDLVTGLGARTIVELGTSYGYSTLFLAAAAQTTGGCVHTYEASAEKQAHARSQIEAAGLASCVIWHLGDALELLPQQSGPIDFALLDIWKELYIPCFEILHQRLSPGGVVVADNMLSPPQHRLDAQAFQRAVRSKADIEAVTLPIGHGVDIIARKS